jgi:predicted transcriptional regulator
MHGLTLEVGGKGTLSVRTIEKSSVSICTECARKDADVAKHALLGRYVRGLSGNMVIQLHTPPEVYPRRWTSCTEGHS